MDSTAPKVQSISHNAFLLIISLYFLIATQSLAVLLGWFLNIDILKRISPAFTAMNPLTAVSFLILIVFGVLIIFKQNRLTKILTFILPTSVITIAALRLLEIYGFINFSVDAVLYSQQVLNPEANARMAYGTAVNFLFIAFSGLLISKYPKFIFLRISQILLLSVILLASTALFFYLSNAFVVLPIPSFFTMAFHTAIALVLLSAAFFVYIKSAQGEQLYILKLSYITPFIFFLILIWVFYFSPQLNKLPENFSYTASIFSVDNLYDSKTKQYSGEVLSSTKYSYQVVDIKDGGYEIKNIFDVRKPNGEKIFSVERLYGVDPISRQHISHLGDKPRNGYLFGPQGDDKKDFVYWHINYDQPLEMHFVSEEDILGLKTYRYSSEFMADQTKNLTNLPDVGVTKGIELNVNLSLWIEPQTGRLIKYEDNADAYYYDLATHQRLEPWNKFSNRFTYPSISEQVSIANQEILTTIFIRQIVPIVLLVLGLICLGLLVLERLSAFNISNALPYVFLLLLLVTTYFAWSFTTQIIYRQKQDQFENDSSKIKNQISQRLFIYSSLLEGGRGLFEASDTVERDELTAYVKSLALEKNYPGIQGLGYAPVIELKNYQTEINRLRKEVSPDFSIRPEGDREYYTPVLYLEPFDLRNQRAFGFDMFSEATRKTAILDAVKYNKPVISGKVTLVQEVETEIQPGFLMYLPVIKKGVPVKDVYEISDIQGFVYAPFRIGDFIKGVFREEPLNLDLEIIDGEVSGEFDPKNEMYDADLGEYSRDENYKPLFTKDLVLNDFHHPWRLRVIYLPSSHASYFQQILPTIVIISGLIFSLLIFLTTLSLANAKSRAYKMAESMTLDLKQKTLDLEKSNQLIAAQSQERENSRQILQAKSTELERANNVMVGREVKMIELKKEIERLKMEQNKNG
jgi:CHASE1-domain containing sensor protein